MSFGNILKKIRQENGLTQEELAKKINTARSNIANYENDKNMPSVDILEKLSEIFNVSTDFLLGKTDKRNNDTDLSDIRFAQHNGIDTNGLSEEDIEEIKKQVEYMRWKRKNK